MMASSELERLEPFARLSTAGKAVLAQGLTISSAARASTILHKGQPVSGAYFVIDGRLRVFTIAPNGAEATLYFIDPGETCVLSLNCLFNDLLYPAWVQTETKATVAVIPGAVYRRLFESEAIVQNLTVQAMSTLVYRLMGELERVHAGNHRQRLVQFILMHASGDGVVRMTQQQIAQHQGTTREVIARLIKEFVDKGFVRTQRGSLTVLDLFGLRRTIAPDVNPPKMQKRTALRSAK
jgi:CRP/FNR family transcriptional regulator, anaerobic regulatory protein